MEKDIFKERERALEAVYFHDQDTKLIEKLRESARLEEIAKALAEKLQVDNPELLHRVMELGVTLDTAPAFLLAPLVQVAWAEGEVTEREYQTVLRFAGTAASRRVPPPTPSSSVAPGASARHALRHARRSSRSDSRSSRRVSRRSASSGSYRLATRWQRRQVVSPRCSAWGVVSRARRRHSSIPSLPPSGAIGDLRRMREQSPLYLDGEPGKVEQLGRNRGHGGVVIRVHLCKG